MRDLIKIAAALGAFYACVFVVMRLAGFASLADVERWLDTARAADPMIVAAVIVGICLTDLILSVPTKVTVLMAGHFLGALPGALTVTVGLLAMGSIAYWLGRRYGRTMIARLIRDEKRIAAIEQAYAANGPATLLVCQALPMLPEMACTLAGVSRMPYARFLAFYAGGVFPMALVLSWAGERSTLSDPWPALAGVAIVTAILAAAWRVMGTRRRPAA